MIPYGQWCIGWNPRDARSRAGKIEACAGRAKAVTETAADKYVVVGTWQGANGDIRHDDKVGQQLECARLLVAALRDGISVERTLREFVRLKPFVDLLADPEPDAAKKILVSQRTRHSQRSADESTKIRIRYRKLHPNTRDAREYGNPRRNAHGEIG